MRIWVYERIRQLNSGQLPPFCLQEGRVRVVHPLSLCSPTALRSRLGDEATLARKDMIPLLNALTHNTYFLHESTPLHTEDLAALLAKHRIRVLTKDGSVHTVCIGAQLHSQRGSMQGGWTNTNTAAQERFWREFTELSATARDVRETESSMLRNQEIEEEIAALEEKREECVVEQKEEARRVWHSDGRHSQMAGRVENSMWGTIHSSMEGLSAPHKQAFQKALRQEASQLQNDSLSPLVVEWRARLEQKEEEAANCSARAASARTESELLEKQKAVLSEEWRGVDMGLKKHREVIWEEEAIQECNEAAEEEESIARQLQKEEAEVQRCAEKVSGKGRQKRRKRVVETAEELRGVEAELKELKGKQAELVREMGLLGVVGRPGPKQSLATMRADVDVDESGMPSPVEVESDGAHDRRGLPVRGCQRGGIDPANPRTQPTDVRNDLRLLRTVLQATGKAEKGHPA